MSDGRNPLSRAGEWYESVMKTAILDDGVKQQCHFDKLTEMVQSDSGSAQLIIQMLEQDLNHKGAEDGVTLRGVWIASAFLLSTDVNDDVVRHLRRFAPKICQKAMDLLKENGMI